MIPPIKEVRLRSINRWLKDKGQTTQSGAQSPALKTSTTR